MSDFSKTPAVKPWEHAKASGSEADPLATRFVSSLDFDKRMYPHDIAGSRVQARMLGKVNLITQEEVETILAGLDEIESEIKEQGDSWSGWKVELEDVHMCVEAALIEKAGDAGRKLHTGRSRNDQVALDLLLWIKDATHTLEGRFEKLLKSFVTLAQKQGMIVMPSYTHLQRAQPIVLGGELMAWVTALDRCRRRFLSLNAINQRNPLGSGAIAGSALNLDRALVATQLGVGPASSNSIDSTASRDAAIDFVYALSMTAMTLSRWAEQWIIYSTAEFSFLRLDDKYTTGSSMMPQKKNPDMLELIRGKCGQVYGSLTALLTMCKGITIGYNRDLQEDKRHVFSAFDCVMDSLAMASGIAANAQFNEKNISSRLDRGFLDATSLADYLVGLGVPFRTAHQLTGELVQLCEKNSLTQLSELTLEQFNDVCQGHAQVEQQVYDFLGAENVVKRYKTLGNAGVSGFTQQLTDWQQRLEAGFGNR